MNPAASPKPFEFTISRVLDAPRDLVWKAWTEPERLMQWWSPKGFTTVSCKVDLRVGGTFHYGLRTPDGQDMWGKFIYREIVPPERLVHIVHFSDARGGVTRHPMHATWPLKTLSTITFEAQGKKTLLSVRWVPFEATDEEIRTFTEGRESMKMGWGGTIDQLEAYLAAAVGEKGR
jgi:uncharacterized protein YndB with AHSA1/START domain